ncbi:hypothetical protein PISMIDRAFT_677058 [Pisolithus microcarpus 441]|uniref:Uncharacterized protein n=1 Tax=Pisolithus microcarpus 441 TaxID=765257 RepID=A0A0C9ZIC1_9AGAM|nr:hypothetical protein PISMIDRAFT_677058 [Pisolithus microcarpus 441]
MYRVSSSSSSSEMECVRRTQRYVRRVDDARQHGLTGSHGASRASNRPVIIIFVSVF